MVHKQIKHHNANQTLSPRKSKDSEAAAVQNDADDNVLQLIFKEEAHDPVGSMDCESDAAQNDADNAKLLPIQDFVESQDEPPPDIFHMKSTRPPKNAATPTTKKRTWAAGALTAKYTKMEGLTNQLVEDQHKALDKSLGEETHLVERLPSECSFDVVSPTAPFPNPFPQYVDCSSQRQNIQSIVRMLAQ